MNFLCKLMGQPRGGPGGGAAGRGRRGDAGSAAEGDAFCSRCCRSGGDVVNDGTDAARSDEAARLVIRRLGEHRRGGDGRALDGQEDRFRRFPSARKSRSMLEFVRLMRARMHLGNEVEITEEIQRLREKLERNRSILEMHYDAVREVAAIIVKAIKEADARRHLYRPHSTGWNDHLRAGRAWVCILTAGTSYAVAYWKENGSLLPAKDEYLDGLHASEDAGAERANGRGRQRAGLHRGALRLHR